MGARGRLELASFGQGLESEGAQRFEDPVARDHRPQVDLDHAAGDQ
jgi:hypothetical protein